MSVQHNKYFDDKTTYLLILFFCLYALLVCGACYMVLRDDVNFGVMANPEADTFWRVSE